MFDPRATVLQYFYYDGRRNLGINFVDSGTLLWHESLTPQMDHPRSQQILFNPNAQGLPVNPQRLHEPPQQRDGVAPPETPAMRGGNVNFQQNQYRVPPTPLPNVERTLREILQPQRTTTNSCIRLPE